MRSPYVSPAIFLMENTEQDFDQNERSKEESQRDESLLVSYKNSEL